MGMSDYDLHIKGQEFRIAELINEIGLEQFKHQQTQQEVSKLCNEIAKLNSHIQTLETTLSVMSGELHALRMETQ
jgi:hypothetical protein